VSWIWPALIALIGAALYSNTLGNEFALDDVNIVRDNPHLQSLAELPRLFTLPYWPDAAGSSSGLYRPVTLATFALNRALTGTGPAGLHAVNAVLHAVVAALSWFAFRRAGTHYGTALLGSLLFAAHPIHTEAVANLVGRSELLAAAGVLAAWLAHRRAADAGSSARALSWTLSAALLYALAVLSKETAALAPVLFLADDLHRGKGQAPLVTRRKLRAWGLYGMAFAACLALRAVALGGIRGAGDALPLDNPVIGAGTFTRTATALWVQVRYAWLTVWPYRLSSDYSFDVIPVVRTVLDPRFAGGAAFALAAVLLGIHGWRRSRPVFLAAVLWVVFFIPTSNLILPVGALMAERLAYLPSLGLCLLAGHVGARVAALDGPRRRMRQIAVIALALVALAVLGERTWRRNPVWRNNETLALHDVEVTPRSAKLQAGAAIVLAGRGDDELAERHFRAALEIYPDYAQVHYNLGIVLLRLGDRTAAIEHLRRSATLAPGNPRPRELLQRLRTGEPGK
jgi:tetratricopeptide (TPR) repeat protein